MCQAFIEVCTGRGWLCYPETGGYDIVLVNPLNDVQIGVEAKQSFNCHVLCQATESIRSSYSRNHPDFLAVLVPKGGSQGIGMLARQIGVTVITAQGELIPGSDNKTLVHSKSRYSYSHKLDAFKNAPPNIKDQQDWQFDQGHTWHDLWPGPDQRIELPDYIPDVRAGQKSPLRLTHWKISAIKICILLDHRGYLTRQDFIDLRISMSRWSQNWLDKGEHRGQWVKSKHTPDYKATHPVNYAQIKADFPKWGQPLIEKQSGPLFETQKS